MVTGTGWPGGDPFLQRQNEPSVAVSSVNPNHLLGGANDYRTVDLPAADGGDEGTDDAWLGFFKSLDGGLTWKSYLIPGYPQEGLTQLALEQPKAHVCGTDPVIGPIPCTSAADPVVRAGPDGMFYYSGITFNRTPTSAGGNYGKVFITRFIDLNDKEDGDASLGPIQGTDPIRYVDQQEVALGGPADFVDKPWIAVDVPRGGSPTCTITVPGTSLTRTFARHTVYVTWQRLVTATQSEIMVRHSDDCGSNWSAPVKVSDATSLANQGPTIAIDPVNGHVYVLWRRAALNGQTDAIMITRSFSGGARFTAPRQVAAVTPFDQPSVQGNMFRVTLFPSAAISVDAAGARRLHVAWSERKSANGEGRVMVATKLLSAPPPSNKESDENDSTCQRLDPPVPADGGLVAADGLPLTFSGNAGISFGRGHQFMPALTFSQGRLMLVYYDSRMDHTRAYYVPHNVPCPADLVNGCWTTNSEGSYYDVVRGPLGAPQVLADGINGPETLTDDPGSQVFGTSVPALNWPSLPYVDESTVRNVRHTVEVRVAEALPADTANLKFTPAPLSRFPFGTRGDEAYLADRAGLYPPPQTTGSVLLPAFLGDEFTVASIGTTSIPLVTNDTIVNLQQFKFNPPNLPMFRAGTTPFMGDYIDVQGPAFVKKSGKWAFNTDATTSPVFHAVWTTNEDVRPPLNGDWSQYVPIFVPGQSNTTSLYDGSPRNTCSFGSPTDFFNTGSRNQNVYSARITEGLLVSSPQNAKPLSSTTVTSFVIAASNTTGGSLTATFTSSFVAPVPSTARAAFGLNRNKLPDTASFSSVTAVIPPHSTVSKTLFVISSVPAATLTASVTTRLAGGAAGPSGSILLNAPGTVPGALRPPDYCDPATCFAFGEVYQAIQLAANLAATNLSNTNLSNTNLSNTNLSNTNLSNTNLSNTNLSNTNLSNAGLTNLSNTNLSNTNLSNTNLSNTNLSNTNLSNTNLSNTNLSNASISDLNYEFQNTGNTSTSYAIRIVGTTSAANPLPTIQLILAKTYTTPTAVDCTLREDPHNHILASVNDVSGAVVSPTAPVNPGVADPGTTVATLTLAPGEKAQVTLRAKVSLARMAEIGGQIAPRPIPQGTPIGGTNGTTTYGNFGGRVATTTTTTYDPTTNSLVATVTAGTGRPTASDPHKNPNPGQVTFVANGNVPLGTVPLSGSGTAAVYKPETLSIHGVTAFYSGFEDGTVSYGPSQDSWGWVFRPSIPATSTAASDRGVASLNNQIFVFGGFWGDGHSLPDVLRFSPASDGWQDLGPALYLQPLSPGYNRWDRARGATIGNAVYDVYEQVVLATGYLGYLGVQKRDSAGAILAASPPIPATTTTITDVEAVVGLNGLLYVLGIDTLSDLPHLITIDPATVTATTLPSVVERTPLPIAIRDYAAVAANGRIYVLGGTDPTTGASSTAVWEFTPGRGGGTWRQLATPMPVARSYFGAALLNGKIYAAGGGLAGYNTTLGSVDVFTPPDYVHNVPGSWAAVPPPALAVARRDVSVAAANGTLYVIGGKVFDDSSGNGFTEVNVVEAFTP